MRTWSTTWNKTPADFPPFAIEPDIGCRDEDPEMFFPPSGGNAGQLAAQARKICRRCPHVEQCLRWALETRQAYGIWGGTTPGQRKTKRKEAA